MERLAQIRDLDHLVPRLPRICLGRGAYDAFSHHLEIMARST